MVRTVKPPILDAIDLEREIAEEFRKLPPPEREPEPPADEAAVAEGAFHFFRQRTGRDVEILRRDADQQVADATSDQEGFVAGFAQSVEHAQRIG